jgi:glycosyltransferase involved in cell wall biosynthesis
MLPLHGVDTVLDSIKILSKRDLMDKVTITFVGGKKDSKFVSALKKFSRHSKLKDHVKHIEWVDYDKLPEFIDDFQLGLGGPFGGTGQAQRVITGKTYQLLAMAKPVVIGKIESMRGFKDKENCLIVEQNSAAALASALEWAITNEKKLKKVGQNGRKLYEKEFSAKVLGEELKALIV